ncbi:MAG TPA: MBL fold metallo-hydrolase [Gaiellaceae bacterium]|nr:MBL fold metallo-hydrolase [Gaiellaceae bacterium]
MELTWLGHSTTLIELDGVRLLTDPLLRDRVLHLVRSSPATRPTSAVDAILISHAHGDHLDRASLRLLPRSAKLVVPKGVSRFVKWLRFDDVVEVAAGDELRIGDVRVRVTPAEHNARAVGYVVDGTSTAYFAGDTDLFDGMADFAPHLDLAMLPISGWGPALPEGHLNPTTAAQALALLRPRVCVPIHWGTFRPIYRRKPYESDTNAPQRFVDEARKYAPDVEIRILSPGETCAV